MLIKLTEVRDGQIASYAAKFVKGTKLTDGEEWEKGFFANQKELKDALLNFEIGDDVNVVLAKNGTNKKTGNPNYKIVDFKEVTDDDRSKMQEWKNKDSGGGKAAYSTGGTKAWGGRTGEAYDRSAAIYLAFDMIKSTTTEAALRKQTTDAVLMQACVVADAINSYIHDGIAFIDPNMNVDMPDDMEPPDVD